MADLIRFAPFRDLERVFGNDPLFPLSGSSRFGGDLATDIFEEDDAVRVRMHIPGIDPQKLDITADEDSLRVSGTREEEQEVDRKNYYAKEIRRGAFERYVQLSSTVDPAQAEVTCENGVLSIRLPKKAESRENRVKLKVK